MTSSNSRAAKKNTGSGEAKLVSAEASGTEGDRQASALQRQALIVLGMHRSGTSALTRALNLLGARAPNNLMEESGSNPKGYWESTVIKSLNDKLLSSGGSNWKDWHAFPTRWYETAEPERFQPRALKALKDEFGMAPIIVFKDPRVCRIFPFWRDVFAEAQLEGKVILSLRHPTEIAVSLHERDNLSMVHGLLLWLRHMLEAEFASRGMPRAVVSFDRLLMQPSTVVATLQDQLDLVWPRLSENMREKIDTFVDPSLRNHVAADPRQVTNAPAFREWLNTVYGISLDWSESGERKADHTTLDQIRHAMNDLATPLREIVADLTTLTGEKKTLQNALEKREADISANEAAANTEAQRLLYENEALQRELAKRDSDRDTVETRLETQIRDLRLLLDEKQSRSDLHEKKLETLLAQKEDQIKAQEKMMLDLRDQLAQTESALRQRAHEADSTAAELHRLTRSHEEQLSELQKEVMRAQDRLQRRQDEISELRNNSEKELARRFDEIGALTRRLIEQETAFQEHLTEKDVQLRNEQAAANDLAAENTILLQQSEQGHDLATRVSAAIRVVLQEGLLDHGPLRRIADKRKARLLQALGLFDAQWYADFYEDIRHAGVDPALHFVRNGFFEGRAALPQMVGLQDSESRVSDA